MCCAGVQGQQQQQQGKNVYIYLFIYLFGIVLDFSRFGDAVGFSLTPLHGASWQLGIKPFH